LDTRIHTTVDALGNPVGSHLTGGQACDLEGADVLQPQSDADILLADTGFDADQRVLIPWQQADKVAVIPPKANRKVQREYYEELYTAREISGLLTTAGKLLFCSDLAGNLVAYDPSNGTPLWLARVGAVSNAPESYLLDGRQYVLIAVGDSLFAFTLGR
jgi:transposase